MARVSRGGGAKGRRLPQPSASELMRALNKGIESGFIGLPTAASKAEFSKVRDIFDDKDILNQYGPTKYNNLAGLSAEEHDEYYDPDRALYSRQFYEVIDFEDTVPGMQGPQLGEDSSPADLTLIPTSTTNPDRPRTVAAGYDETEEKLTVMFRDGTLYNYYEVSKNEWLTFKSNRSKGVVIYSMLDFKPRGYADDSNLRPNQRQALYRFARSFQTHRKGRSKGQGGTAYKPNALSRPGTVKRGKRR